MHNEITPRCCMLKPTDWILMKITLHHNKDIQTTFEV